MGTGRKPLQSIDDVERSDDIASRRRPTMTPQPAAHPTMSPQDRFGNRGTGRLLERNRPQRESENRRIPPSTPSGSVAVSQTSVDYLLAVSTLGELRMTSDATARLQRQPQSDDTVGTGRIQQLESQYPSLAGASLEELEEILLNSFNSVAVQATRRRLDQSESVVGSERERYLGSEENRTSVRSGRTQAEVGGRRRELAFAAVQLLEQKVIASRQRQSLSQQMPGIREPLSSGDSNPNVQARAALGGRRRRAYARMMDALSQIERIERRFPILADLSPAELANYVDTSSQIGAVRQRCDAILEGIRFLEERLTPGSDIIWRFPRAINNTSRELGLLPMSWASGCIQRRVASAQRAEVNRNIILAGMAIAVAFASFGVGLALSSAAIPWYLTFLVPSAEVSPALIGGIAISAGVSDVAIEAYSLQREIEDFDLLFSAYNTSFEDDLRVSGDEPSQAGIVMNEFGLALAGTFLLLDVSAVASLSRAARPRLGSRIGQASESIENAAPWGNLVRSQHQPNRPPSSSTIDSPQLLGSSSPESVEQLLEPYHLVHDRARQLLVDEQASDELQALYHYDGYAGALDLRTGNIGLAATSPPHPDVARRGLLDMYSGNTVRRNTAVPLGDGRTIHIEPTYGGHPEAARLARNDPELRPDIYMDDENLVAFTILDHRNGLVEVRLRSHNVNGEGWLPPVEAIPEIVRAVRFLFPGRTVVPGGAMTIGRRASFWESLILSNSAIADLNRLRRLDD